MRPAGGYRLLHSQPGALALAHAAVDPAVSIATLAAMVAWFGGRFDGACLILALLVFAMTFPGSLARPGEGAGELMLDIVTGWAAIVALLLLLGWASHTLGAFDPRVLLAWAIATPGMLFVAHRLVPRLLPRLLAAEGLQKTAVVAGANELGRRLAERIRGTPLLGQRFVGYFDDRAAGRTGESVLGSINGLPVVAVCETPFHGFNGAVKRASDIVLASLILVLISPLLLAIALGVKLSSPGPILFKQRRYGLDGRKIVVYKFRSMTVAEDGDLVRQATRNDSRITRFGAFLRRTSLDELPQFINVLQGRMSVVGPRPHAVAHNELYRKLIRGYMIRHKVRPGITGLAQVMGWRGETETVEKMKGRIEMDLTYLRNWSVLLDLQIILKTIVVVLGGRNAY